MTWKWNIYPVKWQDGELLTPEHLQTLDNNIINNIGLFQQLKPYNWGIIDISIDQSYMNNGIIKINCLAALLPNGKFFTYNKDWLKVNSINNTVNQENVYSLEINLNDFSILFEERKPIIMGLSLQKNYNHYCYETILEEQQNKDNPNQTSYVGREILRGILEPYNSLNVNSIPIGEFVYDQTFQITNYIPPVFFLKDTNIIKTFIGDVSTLITYHSNLRGEIMVFPVLKSLINRTYNLLINKCHPYEIYLSIKEMIGVFICQINNNASNINVSNNISNSMELTNSPYRADSNIINRQSKDNPIVESDKDCGHIYNHNNIIESFNRCIIVFKNEFSRAVKSPIGEKVFYNKNLKYYTFTSKLFKDNKINMDIFSINNKDNMIMWINQLIICSVSQLERHKQERNIGMNRSIIFSREESNIDNVSCHITCLLDNGNDILDKNEQLCLYHNNPLESVINKILLS